MLKKHCSYFIRWITALSLVMAQTAMAAPTAAGHPEPEQPKSQRSQPAKVEFKVMPKLGEQVAGHLSPERTEVYYEGKTDEAGRYRVYSYQGEKNGTPGWRRGVLEANGRITWDGAFHSRPPGLETYPRYPEVRGANSPVPRSHALVPAGPVVDVPRGSGVSEINSPGREYLPEFSDAKRWRRLRMELRNELGSKWDRVSMDLQRSAKEVVHNVSNSEALNRMAKLSAQTAEKAKQSGSTLARVGVTFYIALGFVAAYHLMNDHSHNPMAWDSYIQGLPWNDPMAVVALVGFLAGAAFFFKKMGNAASNGGVIRTLPFFAGALLAGTFVSTSVTIMWGNDDVKKCVKSKLNDESSCDAAAAWFTSSPEESGAVHEIANGYVPLAANVLAAGGIYLGVIQTTAFIANKFKIADALARFSPGKAGRAGGAAGWAMTTIHMILFLGAAMPIASSIFGIEKGVREHLIAEMGLFSHHYGRSLSATEQNLFTEWQRLKKNGWKDPNKWDKVCVDLNRNHQVLFNCDAPDQLDLEGVLNRYGKLLASWRGTQMQETMGAYQQWMKKQLEFHDMVDISYQFYKTNLPLLAAGQFTPQQLKRHIPTTNPTLAGMNMDGHFSNLYTRTMPEFLLASMACGPEADGYGSTGLWQKTKGLLEDYVTGAPSPRHLIENPAGSAVRFFPPRITRPLPGANESVCQKTSVLPELMTMRYDVTQVPLYLTSFIQADYRGLPDYIKDNIRQSVVGPEVGDNFDGWWTRRVTDQVLTVQNELLKEYRAMLNGVYKKAVLRDDRKWCEPSKVSGTGLEKYMRLLVKPGEKCGPEALHRLSYGIFDNLRDELRLYLALLSDLYMSNLAKMGGPLPGGQFPTSAAQVEEALVLRAQRILAKFDEFVAQLAVVDPAQRGNIDKMTDEAVAAFNDFSSMVLGAPGVFNSPPRVVESNGRKFHQPEMPIFQAALARTLLMKSQQVFKDSLNYYNILTALDREPKVQ